MDLKRGDVVMTLTTFWNYHTDRKKADLNLSKWWDLLPLYLVEYFETAHVDTRRHIPDVGSHEATVTKIIRFSVV